MKKIFAILLSALALGGCENDGIPYVRPLPPLSGAPR